MDQLKSEPAIDVNEIKEINLLDKLKEGSKDGKLKGAIKLEHTMQNICSDMRHVGVNFNHKKASELEQRLYLERSGYEDLRQPSSKSQLQL